MLSPGNAMIFSRRILDFDSKRRPSGLGDTATRMTHDEWTYFIGTAIGWTHFSPNVFVYYRQHGTSVFGASGRSSLRERIAPGNYEFLAERANERKLFFKELEASASAAFERECYRRAAEHYGALFRRLEARAAVYSANAGFTRRLATFSRLAGQGGYKSRTRGGLGLRSFLKDASHILMPGAWSPPTQRSL